MKRREFIVATGAAIALTGGYYIFNSLRPEISDPTSLPPRGFAFGDGLRESPKTKGLGLRSLRASTSGRITILNDHGKIVRRWTTPFLPHAVLVNPLHPHLLVGIQKWGEHMAIVDVRNPRDQIKIQYAPKDYIFFGHGAYIDNGKMLAISMQNLVTAKGEIHLLHGETFETLRILESYGTDPHDLQVDIEDSNLLIVANSGSPVNYGREPASSLYRQLPPELALPNLAWINWKSGQLVRQFQSENTNDFLPGHFLQTPDRRIFAYGDSTRPNRPMTFGVWDREQQKLEIASKKWAIDVKGECLNTYFDQKTKRAWLALPDANQLFVVNTDSMEILKKFSVPRARSLTAIDDDLLLVSQSTDLGVQQVAFSLSEVRPLQLEEARRQHDPLVELENVYGIHSLRFGPDST